MATNADTVRLWLSQTKGYRLRLSSVIILASLGNIALLAIPWGYRIIVDAMNSGGNPWPGLYYILAANIAVMAGFRISELIDIYVASELEVFMMTQSYQAIVNQSHSYFEKNQSGTIARRAQQYFDGFIIVYEQIMWNFLPNIILLVGGAIILGRELPILAVSLISWGILYVIGAWFFTKRKQRFDLARAAADSASSGLLHDTVVNSLAIRVFGSLRRELKRYTASRQKILRAQRVAWMYDFWFELFQATMMTIIEAGVLAYAIVSWKAGTMSVGTIVLIQGYLVMIFNHLWYIGRLMRRMMEAFADARQMTEIYLHPSTIQDLSNAASLPHRANTITFTDVTFGYYKDKSVISNLSLRIMPGEKIALVGSSGGGKSTIVKLLLRLYDVSKGSITIGTRDIRSVTQTSLRKQIAYVPQDALLFRRTIIENIRYAKPSASKQAVIAAAKKARAHAFISRLPKGYDTIIGERGMKLSGGERQRIALARTFLQDAPVVILDEPTSSLDSISEMEIQKALKELFMNRTVIVIAHRLATIKEMDRICVVERGAIVEEGTHEVLTTLSRGRYRSLWQIQTDHE